MHNKSVVACLRYFFIFVFIMLLSAHPAYSQPETIPQGFSVYKKINLSKGGQLLLLQDSRINEKLRGSMWGIGGVDLLDEKDRVVFADGPPRRAVLMILDAKGDVTYDKQLDCILAGLEKIKFYPAGRFSYILTEDKSIGSGSYAGLVSSFLEVIKGRPRWLSAKKEKSGKLVKISVMKSLKTDWKVLPSPEGRGKDIYQIACRPDTRFEEEFLLIYTRYHFNGKNWIRHERRENGFWESENGFPLRTNFP